MGPISGSLRILGGTRLRKIPSLRGQWVLDEAFGDEREIVREPSVDPAFERANPGDPFGSSSSATRALVASLPTQGDACSNAGNVFSFIDPLSSPPICWLWKWILVLGVVPDVTRA